MMRARNILSILLSILISMNVMADGRIMNVDINSSAAISYSKMANLGANTILGNNTGSPGAALSLTVGQVQSLLSIATTAFGLGYSPTVPGNWTGAPTTVGAGLDELAARDYEKTTVSDTNSIDLTLAAFNISAALRLSSAAAGVGNINASNSIQVDGLQTQVPILVGATNLADGAAGVVPKPLAGEQTKILQGDGTWVTAASIAGINQLTGDVTAGPGTGSQVATIPNDTVTNAKLANMATATFKCRTSAGTGDPEDCTISQAKTTLAVSCSDLTDDAASCSTDTTNASNISSGTLPAARIGAASIDLTTKVTGVLPLANGGTGSNLSATGGTSQVLRQSTSGANITVGTLACSDLSDDAASCSVDTTDASNITSGTLPAARIGANSITNAKLAQMATATFKCRTSAGTGDPEDCTATQAKSSLAISCSDLTDDAASCSVDATNASNISSGTLPAARIGAASIDLTTKVTGLLPIANGGTGQATALAAFNALSPLTTAGDLLYYAAGNNARLPLGSNGQVLTVSGGALTWGSAGTASPLTTKGDLYTYSTINDRLPVGTDGQVLTADSTAATGLKWAAASGGSGSGNGYARFTLDGAVVPFTGINGAHYQTQTMTLSAVNIAALNSGTSGSTVVQVNQYRSGSLLDSATASLAASSSAPAGSAASLSHSLSLASGDVVTVDVNSAATGASDLTVAWELGASAPTTGASNVVSQYRVEGAVVPLTGIGTHYQSAALTLSTVNLSALNCGSSGSTVVQVNQYRSGSLVGSATASLSAASSLPCGSAASLSSSLSFISGDVVTVDVNSAAAGASDLTVEWELPAAPTSTSCALTEKTADYTLTDSDCTVVYTGTGPATFTLKSSATAKQQIQYIKNASASVLTIVSGGGSDTFEDGTTSVTINPGGAPFPGAGFQPNGVTKWYAH